MLNRKGTLLRVPFLQIHKMSTRYAGRLAKLKLVVLFVVVFAVRRI